MSCSLIYKNILLLFVNKYSMSTCLTPSIIGSSFEVFVLEHIFPFYDHVWLWKHCPEFVLYDCNIIRNYDIFKKYKFDIGADLVAVKNNIYYFIQCKNFKHTIHLDDLAGFYFFLHEYNLNGILYYNGTLSQRVIDLSTNKIPFIHLPFNNQRILHLWRFKTPISKDIKIWLYRIV